MSKKITVEDALKQINEDPTFSEALKRLSPEEKQKVDSIVQSFLDNFIHPIQNLVEQADNPDTKAEIRKILESEAQKKS